MRGEKIAYLYFLNERYQILDNQEVIDSFILPSLELKETSGSQILTIGMDTTHSLCEFLVWGQTIDKVMSEYENGVKNILEKMSDLDDDSDFQRSIRITLNQLEVVETEPLWLLVQVGDTV